MLSAAQRNGLRILEMPFMLLSEYAEQELTENPLLELTDAGMRLQDRSAHPRMYTGTKMLAYEDGLYSETAPCLSEYLLSQINPHTLSASDEALIRNLAALADPETGLLSSQDAFCLPDSAEHIRYCLDLLRALEPPGICAENIESSILRQLEVRGLAAFPVPEIVRSDLALIAAGRLGFLSRKYAVSRQRINNAAAAIRQCQPYPTSAFSTQKTAFVLPDVLFDLGSNDGFEISGGWLDELRISDNYETYCHENSDPALQGYLKKYLLRARELTADISRRKQTLSRIAAYILHCQRDFLEGGRPLHPLRIRTASEALALHPSTVSRAVKDKTAATPLGLMPLRQFFCAPAGDAKVSVSAVREYLASLIRDESPQHPLSDARLQALLAERGYTVSRRAVANYRTTLCIPNSAVRGQIRQAGQESLLCGFGRSTHLRNL
jgi:RNA polymerase sigma-54 factor